MRFAVCLFPPHSDLLSPIVTTFNVLGFIFTSPDVVSVVLRFIFSLCLSSALYHYLFFFGLCPISITL
ncbi:uncharacterized protein EV420DRAFT_1601813 [Desarmillaria tabescens]|uniref:Uncharacterized protein n=1 Tax=Armillaria tabescens TaxID=1929756 RepID=A0AA39J0P8_ARMTA|nr:uncharacterized protein EV420DRAFT_1601813 [Desarmillaria tabescens]KAK0433122.1 hypothetical protein EV420DRAFT_1601813 [Desarmillaria tabescens]